MAAKTYVFVKNSVGQKSCRLLVLVLHLHVLQKQKQKKSGKPKSKTRQEFVEQEFCKTKVLDGRISVKNEFM